MKHTSTDNTRREEDLLGSRDIPINAYYGIQSLRAKENFQITGEPIGHYPKLIVALAMVKYAAARANCRLRLLPPEIANAICQACDDIIAGQFHDAFIVDVIQGGAGTSTNMNANEVIANRALELLGYQKGRYDIINPNNHVNLSQSTNDAYPTSLRLCLLMSYAPLYQAIIELGEALAAKGCEFSAVIKMGRTQLQDAVPITLGQEFDAYRATIKEERVKLDDVIRHFCEINLGATAIGTGINTDPEYCDLAIAALSQRSGYPLVRAANLIEATSDMGAFVSLSSVLKRTAIKLSKLCNDLRLMSSGPRAGFGEINLPAMQPGSSIMPGKVNPVIPEMVNQVAYQVIGNDLTITMAAEAGQLELNVMEPVIAFNLLQSLKLLTNATEALSTKCIQGITANKAHCEQMVKNSIGILTAINPYLDYHQSSSLAKEALETGKGIITLIEEKGLFDRELLEKILDPHAMVHPRKPFRHPREGGDPAS